MTGTEARISDRTVWMLVLVISAGWGTGTVVIRVALREGLGPITTAAASSLIAAVGVTALLVGRRKGMELGPAEWRIGAVLSVLSVLLPYQVRNLGLQYASAGFISLISSLVPLVTAVVAHFSLAGERLKMVTVASLLIGLAGVAVLLLGGDSGLAEGGNPVLAGSLCLISVVSVSFAAVYAKRYAGSYSVLAVTLVQLALGSFGLILVALAVEGVPESLSLLGGASLVYIGLVGNFLPLALYFFLIRYVTVTYSTIVGYIVPFIAAFAGVWLLDEQIQPGIVLGGALVLGGVVVTDLVRIRDSRRELST